MIRFFPPLYPPPFFPKVAIFCQQRYNLLRVLALASHYLLENRIRCDFRIERLKLSKTVSFYNGWGVSLDLKATDSPSNLKTCWFLRDGARLGVDVFFFFLDLNQTATSTTKTKKIEDPRTMPTTAPVVSPLAELDVSLLDEEEEPFFGAFFTELDLGWVGLLWDLLWGGGTWSGEGGDGGALAKELPS